MNVVKYQIYVHGPIEYISAYGLTYSSFYMVKASCARK